MLGDWEELNQWVSDMGGFPSFYYIYKFIGSFSPAVFFFRLAELLSLAFMGVIIHRILVERQIFANIDATAVALLTISYPGYKALVASVNAAYLVLYAIYLGAFYLMLKQEAMQGKWRFALRFASLFLLFFSFKLSSLLVFHYALLGILSIHEFSRMARKCSMREHFMRNVKRLDYWLIPLIYWIASKQFYPPSGIYAATGYNEIVPSLQKIAPNMLQSLNNGILQQFSGSFLEISFPPALILFFMLVLFIVLPFESPLASPSRQKSEYPLIYAWSLLIAAGLLLLAAVFPYAAVGKASAAAGWNTRHSVLLGLPLGLLIVSATHALPFLRRESGEKYRHLIVHIIIIAFMASLMNTYLTWQARWIKDESVMLKLSKREDLKRNSVFLIQNDYLIVGEFYRFYEWAAMFKRIWGDETRMGLDLRAYRPEFAYSSTQYHNARYFLSEFDPKGCWMHLKI
ncbi:MAG: hypothetical protein GY862_13330, partial [Gammaproteobacteria bacterium]|nr:hypothetical protein [Gammaproteobacteria bacterium]